MLSASYAHGMTISRKLSSVAAVLLLAGLSLSACGDKDDSADDKTGSKPGGGAATLTQANFSQVLTDAQVKAKSAHVDMTVGVGGQSIEAQGDVEVGSSPKDTADATCSSITQAPNAFTKAFAAGR